MPTITVRTALGANAVADVLSGSQYEFLPFPAMVEFGVASDANGVLATVSSGPDILMEEGPVVLKAINVKPVYPDDFDLADEAAAGDRIKVRVRDTSGAARVVMTTVKITPL